MRRLQAESLRTAIQGALTVRHLSTEHALRVADALVETSLHGIDTHGIRLLPTYLQELDGGRARPRPVFAVHAPRAALAVLDADHALGVVAGHEGMRLAIDRARACGIGAVVVKNSNHFGAAGHYARLASRDGLIGLAFSNADALVAPFGGTRRLNGTNPIAMSAPGVGDDGFHLDLATSQVSYTRVREHRASGRPLERGWAQGADGADASDGGDPYALRPLGGYKGQGLGMMVQLLCATLAGMPADAELTHLYDPPFDAPRRIGHCFVAIDVGACTEPDAFRQRSSALLDTFRASEPAGAVKVPGDPERAAHAERTAHGIPVDDAEWRALEPYLQPTEPVERR